jgi:hypothetical protein
MHRESLFCVRGYGNILKAVADNGAARGDRGGSSAGAGMLGGESRQSGCEARACGHNQEFVAHAIHSPLSDKNTKLVLCVSVEGHHRVAGSTGL